MSENKFIQHLKGKDTAKSVLEVKNQATSTSFANMPTGTSDGSVVYSDHRGNATAVLKGTDNWKLSGATLVSATTVYGDGRDLTGSFLASGNTLWVNATYTFVSAKVFTPNTKWVLKLCGHSLDSTTYNDVPFSLLIKIGNSIITKQFNIREEAFEFCKEFVIDFSESESSVVKAPANSTMTVQLLCGDATASATIYNGMTVFTALQRRVDSDSVSSDTRTFDELEEDFDDLRDDFDQFVIDTGTALDGKVNIDGTSIMTAPLKFRAGSMRGAVGPYLNGVSFWKLDSQGNITNIANLTDSQFSPVTTNAIDLGRSANKWKDLYLAGKAYISVINNGYDIAVPVTNSADTLALKSEVDLAANSGRMITDQGVWYAKMYAATVAPAAEDGTNYADFSQIDGQGNPIIVIYERQNGAWVQSETITPPAEYDGYVPITSKIWDITEQAGQQGGRILWNHQSKEFTPYPQIISFEDIEITGESTVIMPYNPSANQIVNKDYVDTLVSNSIGNATITLTQGGQTMGSFTTNQSSDATIALDGGSSYHPDLFDWKWADHELDDMAWLRADTFSWQQGSVYKAAYKHLRNDMYNWYSWENNGTTIYTKKAYPEVGEKVYSNSALTTEVGEITDVTDTLDITVEKITVNDVVYDSVSGSNISPTTEPSWWYGGYAWGTSNGYVFTSSKTPAVNDNVFGYSPRRICGYITAASSSSITFYDTVSNVSTTYSRYSDADETVQYIPAEDGHKIVTDFHMSEVENAYSKTGVAWYYIIDYGFKRFKLPRTKFGVTGLRDNVGNYVAPGLPNITGDILGQRMPYATYNGGAFYDSKKSTTRYSNTTSGTADQSVGFDASLSNAIYGASTTVQPPATQMYLYFYVGQFSQTATEQTAGLNSDLFNGKMDRDMSNMNASQTVKETIVDWGAPDYTAGVSKTWNTDNTAESSGVVIGHDSAQQNSALRAVVNGETLPFYDIASSGRLTVSFIVAKGDVWKVYGGDNSGRNLMFYPMKGASNA